MQIKASQILTLRADANQSIPHAEPATATTTTGSTNPQLIARRKESIYSIRSNERARMQLHKEADPAVHQREEPDENEKSDEQDREEEEEHRRQKKKIEVKKKGKGREKEKKVRVGNLFAVLF